MSGYDNFFKQARKASERQKPRAATATAAEASARKRFSISQETKTASPEDRLKKVVGERVKAQRAKRIARRRQPFPKGPMVVVVVCVALATVAMVMPESVDWVMNHVDVGMFGEANAATEKEAAKTDAAKTNPEEKAAGAGTKSAEKTAGGKEATKAEAMPDTRGWSEEELSFFNKLGERKRELDLREAELNKLEEELQKQRVELGEKLKQLEATRSQIAQTLKSRVDNDQQKVSKLVEVYSGMKPSQAAKVMETLNEDLAIQILDRMKKKSAADILNVMNSDKAQRLSEMLAGYKKPE